MGVEEGGRLGQRATARGVGARWSDPKGCDNVNTLTTATRSHAVVAKRARLRPLADGGGIRPNHRTRSSEHRASAPLRRMVARTTTPRSPELAVEVESHARTAYRFQAGTRSPGGKPLAYVRYTFRAGANGWRPAYGHPQTTSRSAFQFDLARRELNTDATGMTNRGDRREGTTRPACHGEVRITDPEEAAGGARTGSEDQQVVQGVVTTSNRADPVALLPAMTTSAHMV